LARKKSGLRALLISGVVKRAMEESKDTGAASFYDLVYEAERPELFF